MTNLTNNQERLARIKASLAPYAGGSLGEATNALLNHPTPQALPFFLATRNGKIPDNETLFDDLLALFGQQTPDALTDAIYIAARSSHLTCLTGKLLDRLELTGEARQTMLDRGLQIAVEFGNNPEVARFLGEGADPFTPWTILEGNQKSGQPSETCVAHRMCSGRIRTSTVLIFLKNSLFDPSHPLCVDYGGNSGAHLVHAQFNDYLRSMIPSSDGTVSEHEGALAELELFQLRWHRRDIPNSGGVSRKPL